MRNTQATLYKIGRIITFVFMGIFGLTILVNLILLIVNAVNGNGWWVGNLSTVITFLFFLGCALALFFLDKKYAEDAKKAPADALFPVILLLVFGVLSWNLLYTVGGVFGIIAANQEKNGEAPKEEAKAEEKEEKKE